MYNVHILWQNVRQMSVLGERKYLSRVTNQVGGKHKQFVKWPIKFFPHELMSCTADWPDKTNTLNNTVKHIHWCVVINKDKEESGRNN